MHGTKYIFEKESKRVDEMKLLCMGQTDGPDNRWSACDVR